MSDAPAAGGGGTGRIRDRWLVLGAIGIVVVVIVLGVFAVPRDQSGATTSPGPTSASGLSPLDEALQGIQPDGTYSKDTALAVFAASFGPLPGVPTPRRDTSYHSGTLAIDMVLAHWDELTDEQKNAIRDYVGPDAAKALPASFHAGGLFDFYQDLVQADVADITTRFGLPLSVPVSVVMGGSENGDAWAWATNSWTVPGRVSASCTITIPPSTGKDHSRDPYMRWVLMHEVWHCFEGGLVDFLTFKADPAWILEGEASYVADSITGGQGAPPPELDHWRHYVEDPGKPLYSRDYDAVGFYVQLEKHGIDPWKVIAPMVQAGGSDPAFQASGATASTFTDAWGASWFRDGQPTADWAMLFGDGIPSMAYRAAPDGIEVTDGTGGTISAKPNAGGVATVHTTAFVTEFVVSGAGRVADMGNASLDRVVRAGKLDLCTSPSGDCSCPQGSGASPDEPDKASENLRAAVTGEQHSSSVMDIRGISRDDWCKTKPTPNPQGGGNPCPSGCGGSNGDPHLRTVDGKKYDLQAAGEYVLLRSADGSVEIQGRQEPPCLLGAASPPPSFGPTCQATIDSAIAVKVDGHRVGFYMSSDVPTVRIDGKPVDASAIAAADLGQGAKLSAYRRGFELDLPDGTKVWALSVGSFGINLLVKPSQSLFATGVGLLAQVPTTAKLQIPPLPDGTTLPASADRHDRWHTLYQVFAPAWRVSTTSTLFDYDPGKSPASYLVAAYPPEAAPQTTADLDPAVLAEARTTCGAVSDPDLVDQCAYDTAVTGDSRYVTIYQATDQLQTVGTTTLDLAPGATPPPSLPPAVGGTPSGINLVEDHLTNTGASGVGFDTVGPDGTVYVEVGEAGQNFGDVTPALLAIDGQSGKVKQRATPAGGGELAFGAGSLWADEFTRPDKGCAVSRLDPASLAVQATVTTPCSGNDQLLMVPFDDALWVVDPTGADAGGAGAHLRRIDPSTNALDTSPAGSVEMPFLSPGLGLFGGGSLLAPTSAAVIMGDNQHGYFRLAKGSSSFEPLGSPNTGYHAFPAADGIWLQTDVGTQEEPASHASFFDGPPTATSQLTVQYFVIGADDASVFTAWSESDDQADGLWGNPIDGSPPTLLANAGSVPLASGGSVRLQYQDPLLPVIVGDNVLVKLWAEPSPTDPNAIALYEQEIPLP
jgi:hypothetical protein